MRAGEVDVRLVVAAELLAPVGVFEQGERGELGQVAPRVEDQHRLQPAIRQKRAVVQLRQPVPVGHRSPFAWPYAKCAS